MKPITVRNGSVAVKIYCVPAGGRKRWEVRWHWGTSTRREMRTKKKTALLLAEERAAMILDGCNARARMNEERALQLEEAERIAKSLGKTVLQIVYEEQSRAAKDRAPAGEQVPALVERFLQAKRSQGLSEYHQRDLEQRLGRFAKDFQLPISRLEGAMIEKWLDGLKSEKGEQLSGRTWNNYRAALAALFEFARKVGSLAHAANLLEAALPRRLKKRRPAIYTAAQMRLLLEGSGDGLKPALALGAFAGLRSEEITRLHWADFNWEAGYVLLREHVTKTARTRQVPLSANLKAWLKPWAELGSGRVCPYKNSKSLSGMKYALAKRLGLKWGRNALRKSFISYRVALTANVANTALEVGNSPAQIHAHYLDLVTPAEARDWFEIHPKAVSSGLLALKFR